MLLCIVPILTSLAFCFRQLRVPAARSRVLAVKFMLLDVGRVAEALELDARLAAVAVAPTKEKEKGPRRKAAASAPPAPEDAEDSLEASIARQAALLRTLELDCIAAGGSDVGCGLGSVGPDRFSAHIRACRDEAVKAFLGNIPKSCGNCGAAAIKAS